MLNILFRRACLRAGLVASVLGCLSLPVFAVYPEKPITMYVPYGPGSAVEAMIRLICEEASRDLGQSIVIENRTGGLTRLGILALRRAAADGYTLSVSNDSLHVMQPLLDPSFSMQAGKDYEPVARLFTMPLAVVSHPSVPGKDMRSLVSYTKANPGKLNIAVTSGSTTHFAALLFKAKLPLDTTVVPYKSQTQFVPDLISGRVQLTLTGSALKGNIEAGQLQVLATTGDKRWAAFPQSPTLKELGYEISVGVWYGMVAPAGTPPQVVSRLNTAFRNALKSPAVASKMAEQQMADAGSTLSPAGFNSAVDSEVSLWAPILRNSQIKLD